MYPHINLFPEGLAVKHNFSSMSWEEFCVRQAFPDSLVDLMKERIKLVIEKRLFPEKSDNKVPVRKTFLDIRDIKTIGLRVTANKGIESYPFFAKHWKPNINNPFVIYMSNNVPTVDLSFDSQTNKLLTQEQLKLFRKRVK